MPGMETVRVNAMLADPEVQDAPPLDARLQEVIDLGWSVTSEETQYGSYRRSGNGWIVPTRDATGVRHEYRVEVVTPGATIDDEFSEVFIDSTKPEPKRWFLVKNSEPNPITKRFNWQLLTFSAPLPEDQPNA